jgi:hypothetical protein
VTCRLPAATGRRAALALVSLLAACIPQLNWREVQLGRMTTLLPCKPDTASRPVDLGGQNVTMEMAGCQAGPALYAVSRIQAADPDGAAALMAALRQASLANIVRPTVQPQPHSGDSQSSFDILVQGQRSDGTALQARMKWLMAGQDVYQIVAYAEHLSIDQTDHLTTEVRIR